MKRIEMCVIIFLFLCSGACDYFQKQNLSSMEGITAEEILFHVRFLASDEMRGRETFSLGQYVTARYIANEFEKYGLKPAAKNQNYYQDIEMNYAIVGPLNTLDISGKAYAEGNDFEVAAVGSNKIKGEIVFVGYGITTNNYDSYANVDTKERVVMIFEGKINQKGPEWGVAPLHEVRVLNAIKHGAIGMIFVKGTSPKDHKMPIPSEGPILERFGQISAMSQKRGLEIDEKQNLEKLTEFPLVYVNLEVANDILKETGKTILEFKKEIDKARKPSSFVLHQVARIRANVSHGIRRTMNVLGLIEGRDSHLKKEIVVIGAHYDTARAIDNEAGVCKGADDNASGTAALIEVAQAFTECKEKPERSILFIAFTGEEKGVLGSGYYITHPVIPLSKTKVMLNFDMIGRNDPNSIQVISKDENGYLLSISHNISREIGINLARPTANVYTSTDHVHFLSEGIPVIWYFDGGGSFVHKTSDTWDKLSPEKMEKVARLCYLTAHKLAGIT